MQDTLPILNKLYDQIQADQKEIKSRDINAVETKQLQRRCNVMIEEYNELVNEEKRTYRNIEDLKPNEYEEIKMKLPKPGGLEFYLMGQDELGRWISMRLIRTLMKETLDRLHGYDKYRDNAPKELQTLLKILTEKWEEVSQESKDGSAYLKKILKQVEDDTKQAEAIGVSTIKGKQLIRRATIMKDEYLDLVNEDDEEEEEEEGE
ncbi:hypothetical protein GPJ56_006962 [Histomonas meleagridis]|uniref:uncharacterized protein n=1 Tax=Histomonas meleagridis TaxID=135588 RepID=UPI00355A55D4|nr:hypothetical protein GPJ56_006962 [Histomonas meleagridis]KAH0797778.1 hypothetical protein GO595_009407 [Histomonas meleagridis]